MKVSAVLDSLRSIPIPEPVAKAVRPAIFYFVCAWISIALIAYGLALRKYGFDTNSSHTYVSGGAGKVSWARVSRLSFFPVQFTLEGNPALYFIPEEFVTPSGYKELSDLLQSGSLISINKYDTLVVGLTLNPGTALEKHPVVWSGWGNASENYFKHTQHAMAAGIRFILAGLLLFPAAWFARLVLLRKKVS